MAFEGGPWYEPAGRPKAASHTAEPAVVMVRSVNAAKGLLREGDALGLDVVWKYPNSLQL